MAYRVLLAAVALSLAAAALAAVDFSGHKIVRLTMRSQADIDFLRSLPEETDGVTGVDVLSHDGLLAVGQPAAVRLTPSGYAALLASSIPHTVQVHDIAARMRQVATVRASTNGPINDEWYYEFHTFAEIQEKLQKVAKEHPDVARWVPDIAVSHEGRHVGGLRLSATAQSSRVNVSILTAGTHAREWIGEAVALWAIQSLIDEWDAGDSVTTNILKNSAVYVVPCYNPDGYEYTHTTNRYWRKNRRHNSGGSYGVDQNRNWDNHWCSVGASKMQSSDTYCGPSGNSEPEVQGVAAFISAFGDRAKVHLDMHSYSQLLLRPYGWTSSPSADDADMKAVGSKVVSIIRDVHGTKYTSEKIADLYLAAGGPNDYFYDNIGTPYPFTYELGGDDFVVPTSDIQKQGEEIYPSFKHLFEITANM